jgi:hypothetical protein
MAKYRKHNPYHKRYRPVHDFMASEHPLYPMWCNMKSRCYNVDDVNYSRYGGRGISICARWDLSFEAFALDMGFPPTSAHTLDRRDNDKGYSPENCRWATCGEQMRNRRMFKTNSTGAVGVVKVGKRFTARYDFDEVRYHLGRFDSVDAASTYRDKFITLFHIDRDAALLMTERRARYDSSTGIKGISKHVEGYVVRKTINKIRVYLGFRKTFEEAVALWNEHN